MSVCPDSPLLRVYSGSSSKGSAKAESADLTGLALCTRLALPTAANYPWLREQETEVQTGSPTPGPTTVT